MEDLRREEAKRRLIMELSRSVANSGSSRGGAYNP
jgi:hypothetical protein